MHADGSWEIADLIKKRRRETGQTQKTAAAEGWRRPVNVQQNGSQASSCLLLGSGGIPPSST